VEDHLTPKTYTIFQEAKWAKDRKDRNPSPLNVVP
jgi:hypothetical protein